MRVFADVSKGRCAFICRPKESDFGKYNYLCHFFSFFLTKFLSNDKYFLQTATANSPSECEGILPIS